jgi:hypothetical protein
MKIEDWLQWPTNSPDPAFNAAIAVLLVMGVAFSAIVGATVLVPVIIVVGIAKGIHWYVSRPMPTDQLHAHAEQRSTIANFPDRQTFVRAHLVRLLESLGDEFPTDDTYQAIADVAGALYDSEDLANPLAPLPPSNTVEEGRYRDKLLLRMRKSTDAEKTLTIFNETLSRCFHRFLSALPPVAKTSRDVFFADERPQPFATVPLIDVIPDIPRVVMSVLAPFFSEEVDQKGIFVDLRRQLDRNMHEASGVPFPSPAHKIVYPDAYKGTPHEIVELYLQHTPLEGLFHSQVALSFADEQRFEHMHVIGGSGHGKTQFLQHLIHGDLTRADPPALIVIDSQGDMLRKIERLDLFTRAPLNDRLVIIDPEDVAFPPALNMFDMTNARLSGYSLAHREQIEAGVIELYNYIFGALAAELTQKQGTAFAYVARLMLSIPGSTIHSLRELMEDGANHLDASPFAEHIRKLDQTSQAFFQNQFFTKSFAQTRQQIARRLYGVLQVPSFDRMFSSKVNKLDMFEAIQAGKIVLINTSKALLKTDASALFGRYMIALTIRAAFERVAVAERKAAFLIVDEAAEYFDESLETLLSQARKFKLGVLFAHQHLDQLSTALRSSVAANTSIKLAGGVSERDARSLAPDMRTTADFVTSMKKHARSTEFACSIRNVTSNAVRLQIPFGTLEAAPRMSEAELGHLQDHNRKLYAVGRSELPSDLVTPTWETSAKVATAEPPVPVQADDDWRS